METKPIFLYCLPHIFHNLLLFKNLFALFFSNSPKYAVALCNDIGDLSTQEDYFWPSVI